jgi:uncharacterized protein DUF4150
MFPVSTTQSGVCQAVPDTCKTPAPPAPPVPMPYPNVAQCAQGSGVSVKVTIGGKPVIHKGSKISMSSGDEAGSVGGVVSGKIKGEAVPRKFSVQSKVEGQAVVFQTCTYGQNGVAANAPMGVQAAPSQTKVMVSG